MNGFFVSVSEHLHRLDRDHEVFSVNEELPDQYVISVADTVEALRKVKTNKATGPDNIPAWVLKDNATILAPPLTAIFNSSLRERFLPTEWKSANIIPLPKSNPPTSVEKDIRPISLTPIAANRVARYYRYTGVPRYLGVPVRYRGIYDNKYSTVVCGHHTVFL